MSIKVVDEVPRTMLEKRVTYREMIRKDINEALDNRIENFEFEGDYNWKYLAQYAREEASRIFRRRYYLPAAQRVKQELKEKYNVQYVFPNSDWTYNTQFIKFASRQCEDRVHVYAKVDYDLIDRFYEILYEDTDRREAEFVARNLAKGKEK